VTLVDVPAAGVALVHVLVGATLAVAFTERAARDVVAVGEVAVGRAVDLLDRLENGNYARGPVGASLPVRVNAVALVDVPAAGVALVHVLVGATLAVAFSERAARDVVAVGEVAVGRAVDLLDRL
jgi:hypothetical protein